MNIPAKTAVFAVVALVFSAHAGAATLSLVPGATTVLPGSTFSLELVISGLGDGAAPSLADFDVDIGFNPFALAWAGSSLGTGLGDTALGEAFDASFGEVLPGVVNVAEVSFLTVAELDALQSDTFVIAVLDFMALGAAAGTSTSIDILGVLSLGDGLGDPIAVDGASGSVVTVAAIPLPAAVWLLACAIGTLSLTRSRHSRPKEVTSR